MEIIQKAVCFPAFGRMRLPYYRIYPRTTKMFNITTLLEQGWNVDHLQTPGKIPKILLEPPKTRKNLQNLPKPTKTGENAKGLVKPGTSLIVLPFFVAPKRLSQRGSPSRGEKEKDELVAVAGQLTSSLSGTGLMRYLQSVPCHNRDFYQKKSYGSFKGR